MTKKETRRVLSTLLAPVALLLAVDAIPRTRAPERAVAVTFDDLPATPAGVAANDVASLQELTGKLLSAVRKHSPAVQGTVAVSVKVLLRKRSRALQLKKARTAAGARYVGELRQLVAPRIICRVLLWTANHRSAS